jgi:hypothetical protein
MSTGNVLPGILKILQSKKYVENFSASKVAEVTISVKSFLFYTTFFNKPNNTSVFTFLS